MDHDFINLFIFIIITVGGLIVKLMKKPEQDFDSMPGSPKSAQEELPKELRKLLFGDGGSGDNPRPENIPTIKGRPNTTNSEIPPRFEGAPTRANIDRNYRVPVAQPAKPETLSAEDCPRRAASSPIIIKPARKPRPVGASPAQSISRQKPAPILESAKIEKAPISISQKAIAKVTKQANPLAPEPVKSEAKQPTPSKLVPHGIDDFRRGIILQEILGPPVSMR
jgi:hypothetical protein